VNHLLNNPVFHALVSGDQRLGFGSDKAKFFDESVSPFAGFEEAYDKGFEDLYELLPPGRVILYATPQNVKQHEGWELLDAVKGLQLIFGSGNHAGQKSFNLIPLQEKHIEQMMQLAALTKPGPFGPRTIDFGHYFGVFEKEKLVAMAGQRLHVQQFTEISAVCTHPDYLGKGYASALVQHLVHLIKQQGQTPFLHVREDNRRAIEIYQRLGFEISGPMNFYVLKKDALSSLQQ
jgi:ribosomal protein S18 acetylase RimI-like enzyme